MTKAHVQADTRLALRDWTVGQLLEHAAARAPDQTALKQVGADPAATVAWTYAELLGDTRRLAGFLLAHFRPGDHVALWGANSAAWTLYQLAAARAGLVLVTLNPALRSREAALLLRQSRAVGVIADPVYRDNNLSEIIASLRASLPDLRDVLSTADWRTHLSAAPDDGLAAEPSPHDPALILYTSGTTGAPKGVLLTQAGVVNNAWMGSERYALADRLAWLGVLPLFHVGGCVTSTLGCISRLGANIVVPTFEPGAVLRLIAQERVAWFPLVPTIAIAMMEHEDFAATDLSSLQVVLTGATVITPEFVRKVRERFDVDVQVMFGQTEAGGGMTKTYRTDGAETVAGTVGAPYPHTEMRIVDVATGDTVQAGDIGEIRIRSPFMTRTYFDNPAATAAAFDSEGFLRTGDLGSLDVSGYLSVTGRLKEMIIRGGENVYPREVEDALGEYAGVVESAVVGVPHPRLGEEVAAAIRCAGDVSVDPEAVRAFLLDRLARHKVPRYWRVVSDFPRTPSGKIQKFEVVRWFDEPADVRAAAGEPA